MDLSTKTGKYHSAHSSSDFRCELYKYNDAGSRFRGINAGSSTSVIIETRLAKAFTAALNRVITTMDNNLNPLDPGLLQSRLKSRLLADGNQIIAATCSPPLIGFLSESYIDTSAL